MHKLLKNLKDKRSRSWEVKFQQVSSDILKLGRNSFPILLKIQGVSGRLLSKAFLKYSRS